MKETHHEKIMISNENIVHISEAHIIFDKLKSLDGIFESEMYKMVIKDLLPEYQYNQSTESKVVHIKKSVKSIT